MIDRAWEQYSQFNSCFVWLWGLTPSILAPLLYDMAVQLIAFNLYAFVNGLKCHVTWRWIFAFRNMWNAQQISNKGSALSSDKNEIRLQNCPSWTLLRKWGFFVRLIQLLPYLISHSVIQLNASFSSVESIAKSLDRRESNSHLEQIIQLSIIFCVLYLSNAERLTKNE